MIEIRSEWFYSSITDENQEQQNCNEGFIFKKNIFENHSILQISRLFCRIESNVAYLQLSLESSH